MKRIFPLGALPLPWYSLRDSPTSRQAVFILRRHPRDAGRGLRPDELGFHVVAWALQPDWPASPGPLQPTGSKPDHDDYLAVEKAMAMPPQSGARPPRWSASATAGDPSRDVSSPLHVRMWRPLCPQMGWEGRM